MRIAHITDLHLQRMYDASWRELFGKRVVGAFNLRVMGRDRCFDEDVARSAVSTILTLKPDFLAVTGDLSALGLDSEFDSALRVLSPLLSAIPSMVIPGNHDIYTSDCRRRFDRRFAPWMGERLPSGLQKRVHGDIVFVGMDCCQPTIVGSRGRAPLSQLSELHRVLSQTDKRVILLMHYPVVDHDGSLYHSKHPWHSLENADEFLAVLARIPNKPLMILHGHAHRGFSASFEGIPVYNPGSGGQSFAPGSRSSAFNIYDVGGDVGDPALSRYTHDGYDFVQENNDSSTYISSSNGRCSSKTGSRSRNTL